MDNSISAYPKAVKVYDKLDSGSEMESRGIKLVRRQTVPERDGAFSYLFEVVLLAITCPSRWSFVTSYILTAALSEC